jgi:HK97 family phage prohead protease
VTTIFTPALQLGHARSASGQPEFTFRAVSNRENRLGYVISQDAWRLDRFKRNPVFLYSHDYHAPPIGKVTSVAPDAEGLIARVQFDPDDGLAQQVQRKYQQGYMQAVSVGFEPLEVERARNGGPTRIVAAELLEISAVAVPADPDALAMLQALAQRPAGYHAASTPTTTPDPATLRRLESQLWQLRQLQLRLMGRQLAARRN